MFKTFTDKIRKSFSDAADQYDILTSLHKEIGRELVKKVVKHSASTILDVGCGTGYVANKAKFFFPESKIIGLDLAPGMIEKAKELHEGIAIDWVIGDAKDLPYADNYFDLILSNLAYQWSDDLKRSFKEAQRTLAPNGILNITMFGSRTGQELFATIEAVKPNAKLTKLPTIKNVQEALIDTKFKDLKVDYELIKVEFKNLMELLNWMKNIGANQLTEHPMFLGKSQLQEMQQYYQKNFPYNEGICASFEVIWIYGRK